MSNSEERNRQQQPPYIDPALVIDTRLSEIERQQREEKAEAKKHARSQRVTNWLLTIFTGLLFFTSVASDLLMLRYVSLTKQSADAATSTATTASNEQTQMKASGDETKAQIDRLIAQQQRTADANEQSLKRAQAALDASIEASRNDQRAWVGVMAVIGSDFREGNKLLYVKADEPITIGLTIHNNSGKSIARKMQACAKWQLSIIVVPGQSFVPDECLRAESVSVIQPSATITITSESQNGFKASTDLVKALKADKTRCYLHGWITYEDAFSRPHSVKFCMLLRTDLASFGSYGGVEYNDAN